MQPSDWLKYSRQKSSTGHVVSMVVYRLRQEFQWLTLRGEGCKCRSLVDTWSLACKSQSKPHSCRNAANRNWTLVGSSFSPPVKFWWTSHPITPSLSHLLSLTLSPSPLPLTPSPPHPLILSPPYLTLSLPFLSSPHSLILSPPHLTLSLPHPLTPSLPHPLTPSPHPLTSSPLIPSLPHPLTTSSPHSLICNNDLRIFVSNHQGPSPEN